VVQTRAEIPLKKEPTFEDVLKLQKDVAARQPVSDDEKLKLALLHAAAGNLEEAERIVSTVRSRTHKFLPYVEFYLRRQLGDHKEAGKLLAKFAEEDRVVAGFGIERAELVGRVRRFLTTRPRDDRVARRASPLRQPRNFALQRSGDKHTFHLVQWKLIDDRSVERPSPHGRRPRATSGRTGSPPARSPSSTRASTFRFPRTSRRALPRESVTDVVAGKATVRPSRSIMVPVEKSR
jgi:hypothetical protein